MILWNPVILGISKAFIVFDLKNCSNALICLNQYYEQPVVANNADQQKKPTAVTEFVHWHLSKSVKNRPKVDVSQLQRVEMINALTRSLSSKFDFDKIPRDHYALNLQNEPIRNYILKYLGCSFRSLTQTLLKEKRKRIKPFIIFL